MSDAGSDWVSRFLNEGVRGGKRCVVVGGTEELLAFLLSCGYAVAHIDQDQKELDNVRQSLVEEMGLTLEEYEEYPVDVEREGSFAWRADDILVLIRSLHHLRSPGEFLSRMRTVLAEGTILIVDWTTGLFEKQLSGKEDERRQMRESYRQEFLGAQKEEWAEFDRIDAACFAMVEALGWRDEADIAGLIQNAGFADAEILYALPCPCTDYWCRKTTTYYFMVWPRGEQCQEALRIHALQKAVGRSSFD